jgi:hypothetical protein
MALGLAVGEEGRHGAEDDEPIGEWAGGESVMISPPQGAPTPVGGIGQQVRQHEAVDGVACRDERHQISDQLNERARGAGPHRLYQGGLSAQAFDDGALQREEPGHRVVIGFDEEWQDGVAEATAWHALPDHQ